MATVVSANTITAVATIVLTAFMVPPQVLDLLPFIRSNTWGVWFFTRAGRRVGERLRVLLAGGRAGGVSRGR